MKKQAVNYGTVAQYTGRGLAAGVGIGGVMELIRQYQAERADDARRKARQGTSEDTIVIQLPPSQVGEKLAGTLSNMAKSVGSFFTPSTSAAPAPEVLQVQKELRSGAVPGLKMDWTGSINGEPVAPEAKANPDWSATNYALSGLGLMGGAYGGYKLMSGLGAKYREYMLKRRLEAAKKNHMEAVLGIQQAKTAELEYVESVFDMDALIKQAEGGMLQNMLTRGSKAGPGSAPGMSDTVLGTLLLITALGAGGVGYGTKKVLDDRARLMDKEEDMAMDKPRVSRILLKSANHGDVELDNVDAQVALALSLLAHKRDTGYLNNSGVKMAAARLALTPSMIVNKLNLTDIADTVAELKQASELWAELRKPFEKQAVASLASFLAGATGNEYVNMLDQSEGAKDGTDAIAEKVIQKLDERDMQTVLPKEQSEIQVVAQGPEAEKYVESNRQRLAKVIKAMAHNGSL